MISSSHYNQTLEADRFAAVQLKPLDVSAFDFVIPIALVVVAMVKTHPAAAL
jgi:hypothetical protein